MNKEGKFTVVVDDDSDVRNRFRWNGAMSFRAQPGRDTFIVNGVFPPVSTIDGSAGHSAA